MGRSVATPAYSVVNVYVDISEQEIIDYYDFQMSVVEIIKENLQKNFKSFRETDGWVDRECRKILENGLSFVTVSQYCGLVSISLVWDNDEFPELAEAWCNQIAEKFRKVLEEAYGDLALRKTGTMSNGVGVYQRIV